MSDPLTPDQPVQLGNDENDPINEPLTKARLFTSTSDDGSWTEMGLGVVSIEVETVGGKTGSDLDEMGYTEEHGSDHAGGSSGPGGGGKRGLAEPVRGGSQRIGKLVMVALDDPEDVLVSTPLSFDDIYVVQRDTILVWSDPLLGRDMACSFNTKEGCDSVLHDITEYQRSERLDMINSLQGERVKQFDERWAVKRENLSFILEAVTTNTQRFGMFVREHDNYFSELVELFVEATKTADTATRELVSQITLALLKSPYNTEGKIIGQFVESRVIEKCIDIVQYGIGRRDADSGFVSFEERRATFRDPCKLPSTFLPRIHVLYACGYLKDLLPLSLEDGDASSSSLLSMFLTQFKLRLMEDICDSPTILPNAFNEAADKAALAFELAAFINDIAKTVKNGMLTLTAKEHIFDLLSQAGVTGFLHRTIELALDAYKASPEPSSSTAEATPASRTVPPGRAVQLVCDTLAHLLTMQPAIREMLTAGAVSDPSKCLLVQLMRAMTTVETSAELQSVGDVLIACVVDLIPGLASSYGLGIDSSAQKKRDILHFWINGNTIDKPPLFLLASTIASLLPSPAPQSSSDTKDDPSASSTILPLTVTTELRVVYGLKVLARLVEEATEMDLGSGLADLIGLSGLLCGLCGALQQCRQRRWANVQSSAVAFIASLIHNKDARLLKLLRGEDKVIEACMELFLSQCRRYNILASAAAHVFVTLCERVHHEKRTLKGASGRQPVAAGPYASFVRGEDSLSTVPHASEPAHDGQDTVSALVEQYGAQLQAGAPALAERLEGALRETPEEAQQADAESSSVASTIERSGFSGLSEYDALAVEFGVEPVHIGQSPPMDASEMEEQLSVLSRELSEDPLHLEDDEEEGDNDNSDDDERHDTPPKPAQAGEPSGESSRTDSETGDVRIAEEGDVVRPETLSPAPAPVNDLKRSREDAGIDRDADVEEAASVRTKQKTEGEATETARSPSEGHPTG